MNIDGEDAEFCLHGPFNWRKSTRDRWSLTVDGLYVASVERSRSWKKRGVAKPWSIALLGSPFTSGVPAHNQFRTLDAARNAAEKSLQRVVARLATVL